MKLFVVLNYHGRILGYIDDEDVLKLFKLQRDMARYTIEEVKENKKKIKKTMDQEFLSFNFVDDVVMFPMEVEYYDEGFSFMTTEFEHYIENFVKVLLPYLKLEDEEHEIIKSFLKDCYDAVTYAEDDDADIRVAFNETKLVKNVIEDLN